MNTLKMITGILFFLQCFTFTVLAESLPKFAMTISNCFSCGGAALSRHTFGETVQTVNWQFPHYFYRNFQKYNGKENTLPFDLYELITLLAPRPVYIASTTEGQWADPKGEFLSGVHPPVYEFIFGPTIFVPENIISLYMTGNSM